MSTRYDDMSTDHWAVQWENGITLYMHDERDVDHARRAARRYGKELIAVAPTGKVSQDA